MKFLCVKCDEPMKIQRTQGPDEAGSLSVLVVCPNCSQEFAMLTNSFETQLVGSLGVKIGPSSGESKGDLSKCPFSDVVQKISNKSGDTILNSGELSMVSPDSLIWTEGAAKRMANIPAFVRPMAKMGIEKFAKESGRSQVDEKVLDEAKEKFGM